MAGKIDLPAARLHLRIDEDDTAEDSLIEAWIAAAYLAIEGKIFRNVYGTEAEIPLLDLTGIVTNEAINAAARLIVGHLYANREAVSVERKAEVPMAADWLLAPYVDYSGGA